MSSPPVEDKLAKERDLKFKLWLQNKAVKDKAFEVSLFYVIMLFWEFFDIIYVTSI